MPLLELAERLGPYHSSPSGLAMAYFFVHRYEYALARVNRSMGLYRPANACLFKAAAYAEFGRMDDARAAIAKSLALDADLTVPGERRSRFRLGLAPSYAEHLTTALRNAGLSEGDNGGGPGRDRGRSGERIVE